MTRLTDDQIIALRSRMTDKGAPISLRMAHTGRSALREIGYEDVSFTDPQKVFAAMIGVSGYSFDVLASLATEALESRAEIERLRSTNAKLKTALANLYSCHRAFSSSEDWTVLDDEARAYAERIFNATEDQ